MSVRPKKIHGSFNPPLNYICDKILNKMKKLKIYTLLKWFMDGDGNMQHYFCGVFLSYDKALEVAKEKCIYYDLRNNKIEYPLKFVSFINYKTKEKSDVYIEGYDVEDFYGFKFEIRETCL
jgi:hypothetical protein